MPRSQRPARPRLSPLADPRGLRGGQRREGRDVHARYYALHNHPNRREFGAPDYVDAAGRQYRIAFLDRLDAAWVPDQPLPARPLTHEPVRDAGGRIKLWIKVPRAPRAEMLGAARWPSVGAARVALNPVAPGLAPATVRIEAVYHGAPSHATGHVLVTGLF